LEPTGLVRGKKKKRRRLAIGWDACGWATLSAMREQEVTNMRVQIVHASRYGATQGIAERIAATLRKQGIAVALQAAQYADDPAGYDATVIGSAVYFGHWTKPATEFVRRNRIVLANRPVWLFSSGPLGEETNDGQGCDKRDLSEPKEIAEFRQTIGPRDHRVFFGALDPAKLKFTHRLLLKLPANRDNALFPVGDFRDWNEVDGWAQSIFQALQVSVDQPCAVG